MSNNQHILQFLLFISILQIIFICYCGFEFEFDTLNLMRDFGVLLSRSQQKTIINAMTVNEEGVMATAGLTY